MNKAPRSFWIGILFCTLLCLYFLLAVPTFDLDESLYRRVAEEMKLHGDWWSPTWDTRPLLHKPPILYWLIEMFSAAIDGAAGLVSSTAARMPGFLVAIAMTFALGWTRSLYLWMGAFPLITVCSVIFDPLQTLALLPAILIPNAWFREEREGTTRESLLVALSLAAACAIKGLNGLVIPAIAVIVQICLRGGAQGTGAMFGGIARFTLRSILPAAVLSAAWYFLLDQKMGHKFTEEFFWVQHFGRSQTPMEAHDGPVIYYPLVLLIGCGALLPFLVSAIRSLREPANGTLRQSYARMGYPLTFALAFVVIFSFSATKLPHYLWPVWPALAVFVAGQARPPLGRLGLALSMIPLALFSIVALAISLNSLWILHGLTHSRVLASILPDGYSLPIATRLGMAAAAALGAVMVALRSRFVQRPDVTFATSSAFYLLLATSILPFMKERINQPIEAIAGEVNAINPPAGTCMWYSGPHSPTLSLALGHTVYHNRCEPQDMKFLIAPDWKIAECAERGMILVAHQGYLNLCELNNGGTGALSGKPAIPVESVIARTADTGGEGESAPSTGAAPAAGNGGPSFAGADGVTGTEDDLSVQQTAGADGIMGTEDDQVVMSYVGPDKTAGTEDDVPASIAIANPSAGTKPVAQARTSKPARIKHLGGDANAQVMSFVGEDGVEGTADDVAVIRTPGPDQKPGTGDDTVVTQVAGNDGVLGTEDDVVVTQYAGPDKIAGTADDRVVTRLAGPDKIAGTGDDLPAFMIPPPAPGAKNRGKLSYKKPKITHLGTADNPQGTVMNFAGADNEEGTADDVQMMIAPGADAKLNTGDDLITTVMAGDDLTTGTEDDVVMIQETGPDGIAGTPDDTVSAMAVGPDLVAGTEDDYPVTNPLSTALGSSLAASASTGGAKKTAARKAGKPKITHIGEGSTQATVMSFAGEDGAEGTSDDYYYRPRPKSPTPTTPSTPAAKTQAAVKVYAGADSKFGTEDDLVVTQQVGNDRIAGTVDDSVVTSLAGPDKIPGTADDVPVATPLSTALGSALAPSSAPESAARPRANRSGKVSHLGTGKSDAVSVMNFAGENAADDSKKTYVATDLNQSGRKTRGAGTGTSAAPADSTPRVLNDEIVASLNDFAVSQLVGNDKTPGTLDDLVVVQFAGPDKVLGTVDDVRATSGAPVNGPDGKPGTADDQIITQTVGADKIAGTADDQVVIRSAGKDNRLGTADDVIVTRPVTAAVAEATGGATTPVAANEPGATAPNATNSATGAKKPEAAKPPVASLFPKPAASRTARPELKKVSSQVKTDSPEKVKKIAFERTAKTIQWQLEHMDYCEAYLCDDRYQSERVIENIETLIDEFPDTQFTGQQVQMLELALTKAIEYRKNWKKYTPDYEIGLMSQEQVDDAINPLISRLRKVIAVVKKRR